MRKTVVTCDRCRRVLAEYENTGTAKLDGHGGARQYDLCAACFTTVTACVHHVPSTKRRDGR